MNKVISLIVFNLCLIFSVNGFAVTQDTENSEPNLNKIMTDVNKVIVVVNDNLSKNAENIELILAANSHDHEAIEINAEIDEINDEMDFLGEEFKEEMKQMGKELKGLVKSLRKMGSKESSKGAFLGILLDEHTSVSEGVLLLGVTPNGPAQNAGLQADDIILSINNNSMAKDQQKSPSNKLFYAMKKIKPGEQLNILINRDGTEKEIVFKAGKRGDHLQSGINFLADDLEKRIKTNIHIEMDHEAFSGLELYPLNNKLGRYFGSDHGMLILNLPEKSNLTLQQGDVLLKIGDRTPKSSSQTWRILESYDKGETINLTLMRDKQQMQLSIIKP